MRREIPPEAEARDEHGGRVRRHQDARLGTELLAVVAGARRRASRDADPQIDTAHLLHSLLEGDPRSREALAQAVNGTAGTGQDGRTARVLAYLAQRTIGYGMRWRGAVEESAAPGAGAGTEPSRLSPAATAALSEATARAAGRGAHVAEGPDLLRALAADAGCRAAQVLRAAGVDPRRLVVTQMAGPIARSY